MVVQNLTTGLVFDKRRRRRMKWTDWLRSVVVKPVSPSLRNHPTTDSCSDEGKLNSVTNIDTIKRPQPLLRKIEVGGNIT